CALNDNGMLKDASQIEWHYDPDNPSPMAQRFLTGFQTRGKKTNPIHIFYEVSSVDVNGQKGESGDKHYKCCHGCQKVITIMKKMRGNLTSKSICSLYCLKINPTEEEINFASSKMSLDATKASEFLKKLENASMKIQDAFACQVLDEWDQAKFEKLLVEWIVACDQQFEEVEHPALHALLMYTHYPGLPTLNIPG
ncbi:hypothetical protein L208DRAFT_1337330, partial [Tricholoma matsutake]